MIPQLRKHFYFEPKAQELFSSWLLRLSAKAHIPPYAFGMIWFGRKEFWARDIDRRVWPEEAITFAAKLGIDPLLALPTCLSQKMGWEVSSAPGFTPGLLALGIYHRLHRRNGLVFCPECLAEDVMPYFRLHWRLATSLICERHAVWLEDECQRCHAAIVPHRSTGKAIHYCYRCGSDLRKQRAVSVDMEKRLRFFAVQKHLGVFSELTSYERQQLLGKLRLCWHFVSGGRKNAKFWLAAAERGIASPRLDGEKWTQLEYSRIHQRRLWLPVAAELLGDWPTRLRDICRESGCTQRMLIDAAMPKEDSAWLSEIILGLKPSKRREARRRKQLKRKITHRSALSRVGLAAAIQLQFPGFESF